MKSKKIQFNVNVKFDGKIKRKILDDDGGKIEIKKFKRFNGETQFNGGDLNHFDGTIKADGKFNFEGGGSRAKIEVIAIDLNCSLYLRQVQKEKPPFIYVENSDFVSQTQDEIKFSVENDFEEIVKLKDYGGRKNYFVYEFVINLN